MCSKSLLKELHRIKLLHIEIIDNAGRKKTKLLPIEFICTSHNSVVSVIMSNNYSNYVSFSSVSISYVLGNFIHVIFSDIASVTLRMVDQKHG